MPDAFSDAMDDAEEEQDDSETDIDEFLEAMQDGAKTKTIGFGVTPEMMAFYEQLNEEEDIDVDPRETFRDHLEKLANRFPEVTGKAQQIHEIKNN